MEMHLPEVVCLDIHVSLTEVEPCSYTNPRPRTGSVQHVFLVVDHRWDTLLSYLTRLRNPSLIISPMLFLPYLLPASIFAFFGLFPAFSPNIRNAYRLELSDTADRMKSYLDETGYASRYAIRKLR